jgi:hypothetical protein
MLLSEKPPAGGFFVSWICRCTWLIIKGLFSATKRLGVVSRPALALFV